MGNILSGASALATTEAVAAAAAAATVNQAGNVAEKNPVDQKEKTEISQADAEAHPAGDDETNKGNLSRNSEMKEDTLAENAAEMTATQTCDV